MPIKHTAKGETFLKTAVKDGKQRDWLQMRKNQERFGGFLFDMEDIPE
jgi:hypothetical protein